MSELLFRRTDFRRPGDRVTCIDDMLAFRAFQNQSEASLRLQILPPVTCVAHDQLTRQLHGQRGALEKYERIS